MRKTIILALALAACDNGSSDAIDTDTDAGGDRAATIAALTGDVADGETVYGASGANCALCHLADGTGEKNGGIGRNLTSDPRPTKDMVIDAILNPPEDMSDFSDILTNQEIADVTAYVVSAFGG